MSPIIFLTSAGAVINRFCVRALPCVIDRHSQSISRLSCFLFLFFFCVFLVLEKFSVILKIMQHFGEETIRRQITPAPSLKISCLNSCEWIFFSLKKLKIILLRCNYCGSQSPWEQWQQHPGAMALRYRCCISWCTWRLLWEELFTQQNGPF